jgi:hypothetical protein
VLISDFGGVQGKKEVDHAHNPDDSEEMKLQMRTSSAADISAELTRHVSEIMKVATTSSNLKGAYIRALKEAATSFACETSELVRRPGPAHSNIGATMLVEAKLSVLTLHKNCREGLLVLTSAHGLAARLPRLAVLHGRVRARMRVSLP